MASKKFPYKNNTIKGITKNIEAGRNYVNNAVGQYFDRALDDVADTIVGVGNTMKDNAQQLYQEAKDFGNDTKTFFTGDAQPNVQGVKIPESKGTARKKIQAKISSQMSGGGNGALSWAELMKQNEGVSDVSKAMPGGSTNTTPVSNGQLPQYVGATTNYAGGQQYGNQQVNYQQANPQQSNNQTYQNKTTGQYTVDNTRQLEPGVDPIAYRESYDTNNIIGYNKNEQQTTQGQEQSSPEFQAQGGAGNGILYGRATGDEEGKVQTLDDPYSVEDSTLRTRQLNYQSLQSMDSYDIALALSSGYSLYGETAMRDLATNDPAKYKEVQDRKKKIQGGETVNNIASGNTTSTSTQTSKATQTVNNDIETWTNANSTERDHDQVQTLLTGKLANSQVATTATQEMLNINAQIAELEEKIANLPTEAKKAFKGDVPQYIIDAYVANNGQRYQSELNKLQSRYNSALDLYKTELSQKQREAEMDLKRDQYNFNVSQQNRDNNFKLRQQAWTEQYQSQSLLMNNIKTDKNGNPYIINSDGTYRYLDNATYDRAVQQQVQNGIDALNATWVDGVNCGMQCEGFSDTWTNSVYGQTMLPVDKDGNVIQGRSWTYASEKVQYVNSAVPKVGEIAIFQYPSTSGVSAAAKKYGHTMIVTGYDPSTGMITLRGSNKSGDNKVYTTTMSLTDFRTKYYGAGFWDPSKPTRFQKEQQGAVDSASTLNTMTTRYEDLIENAGTQGTKDLLATAQTMYETLSELKDDGSLEELVNTTDFQKVLKKWAEKSYKTDDGGSEFGQLLRSYMYNKNLSTGAKKALNRLYLLVEMKLRNESGAAISSSEWMNNFQNMIPGTFQDKQQMRDVLSNWDIVIKRYSRGGGMKTADYIPIFDDERGQRQIFAG